MSTETRRNVKRAMFGDAFGRQGRVGRVGKDGEGPASREARKGSVGASIRGTGLGTKLGASDWRMRDEKGERKKTQTDASRTRSICHAVAAHARERATYSSSCPRPIRSFSSSQRYAEYGRGAAYRRSISESENASQVSRAGPHRARVVLDACHSRSLTRMHGKRKDRLPCRDRRTRH